MPVLLLSFRFQVIGEDMFHLLEPMSLSSRDMFRFMHRFLSFMPGHEHNTWKAFLVLRFLQSPKNSHLSKTCALLKLLVTHPRHNCWLYYSGSFVRRACQKLLHYLPPRVITTHASILTQKISSSFLVLIVWIFVQKIVLPFFISFGFRWFLFSLFARHFLCSDGWVYIGLWSRQRASLASWQRRFVAWNVCN